MRQGRALPCYAVAMSIRAVSFAPGEWFHCFTRGVDKRKIFMEESDCERFQMLLYTCNSASSIHISNLSHVARQGPALSHVLRHPRGKPLVDIGAYCLMANHPHLLLREKDYGGISAFMQKLGTGYTMYFNKKYGRIGALFSGRFKAVHVASDAHFRRVVNYIHANPAEIYEPGWKKGIVRNIAKLEKDVQAYPYSSLPDYERVTRPHTTILNIAAVTELVDANPSFKTLLKDARDFYGYEKDTLSELDM